MSGLAVLLDTAVVAYTLGDDHPLKPPCVASIDAIDAGRIAAHASVELVQELMYHRLRRTDRATAVQQARDAKSMCVLHDFDMDVLERTLALVASHPRIRGRDAVHAATALEHGIETVLSPDTAFDGIPGLRRVDPRDLADLLG